MKIPRIRLCLSLIPALLLGHPSALSAATFTSNTLISSTNTNFDGEDIVVIGCTVTIDGNHSFSDVLVLDNAIITHSYSPSGVITNTINIAGEQHTLSGTAPATLSLSNVVQSSIVVASLENSTRYTNGTGYTVSQNPNGLTLIARTPSSNIPDGSTVAVSYTAASLAAAGLALTVTNNVIIDAGCAINADGRGYGGGMGPGAGMPGGELAGGGGGGGYAGTGGASLDGHSGGISYGAALAPTNLGSGGGEGARVGGMGGGAIKIVAGGAILIDGEISANGLSATNYAAFGAGAGAGGSVWLTAPAIGGSGAISANGGAADIFGGGGGGGGRIALSGSIDDFFGGVTAYGGAGANGGGAGVILVSYGDTNQVFVDNGGLRGSKTPLEGIPISDATISGGAVALSMEDADSVFENLTIAANSFLVVSNVPGELMMQIMVRQNVTVQPGGAISADGQGFGPTGVGAGESTTLNGMTSGTGGGHGGYGGRGVAGVAGGGVYDPIATASERGSGGGAGAGGTIYSPGGWGGGVVNLAVTGNLQLDGVISANGTGGMGEASGGGSGGTVALSVGSIAGGGLISANGGSGILPNGGGGGGGRILFSARTNTFAGNATAYGGPGYVAGGAGTVTTITSYSEEEGIQLVVDNGGLSGTNTPLSELGTVSLGNLTIANGAVAVSPLPQTANCRNLLMYSNSFLIITSNLTTVQFLVMSNATVGAGCAIVADGGGYGAAAGPGAGQSAETDNLLAGSGGGHGGNGGGDLTTTGGAAYDSINEPEMAGSGGGNGSGNSPNNLGGSGGGGVYLSVGGLLTLNGTISANGNPGVGEASGGGSGGSVSLSLRGFTGTGAVSANGGPGQLPLGGGGGGGRIAVINPGGTTNAFTFSGTISATGGAGRVRGGAGTAFIQTSPAVFPTLVIDNGGSAGTNTPITSVPAATFNLTVSGGGIVGFANSVGGINNLVIGTNSYLIETSYQSEAQPVLELNVNSNVTILAGGGIILDGRGSPPGTGAGPGLSGQTNGFVSGGGGGHGGYGGRSISGGAGGNVYDSYGEPNEFGSGGGGGSSPQTNPGGAGGGGIRLSLNGNFLLNGSLSVNGNSATGIGGGGGSGGSLWVSAAGFSGTGSLSANGGAGLDGGGGGGGGRILVSYLSNSFTGTMSAHGGAGYVAGGAGTIFTGPRANGLGQLVLDNGGMTGTNTPVQNFTEASSITVTGGANMTLGGGIINVSNLLIAANSFITAPAGSSPQLAHLIVNGGMEIQAGAGILLDGCGFPANQGVGAGLATNNPAFGGIGGGAGHGGYGGAGDHNTPGGTATGSVLQPVEFGAGGGNGLNPQEPSPPGAGGGALELTVFGTLTLDGSISARGSSAVSSDAGGGAGGSVWLTVGTLAGAGSIAVDGGGGNPPFGGGGGGGRLALYYTSNQFSGAISAAGGPGFVAGGAGTIYTRAGNENVGNVVLDNHGLAGAFTPLMPPEPLNLSVSDGATFVTAAAGAISLGSLTIGPGGVMTQPSGSGNINVTIFKDALVDTNGVITADGDGYAGVAAGPGGGIMATQTGSGSGAGYGGQGGASAAGTPGGQTYGSTTEPTAYGSRGGIFPVFTNFSAGGGAIELNVAGTLTVNGAISANGQSAMQENAGGGSGGSIWLAVGTLAGSGGMTANGGDGDFLGGGGGGGRVAVYYYSTNQFTGTITASGGEGFNDGGAGSLIYTNQPGVSVVLFSPTGAVTGPILSIAVGFSSEVLPLTTANFIITTPTGVVPADSLTINQTTPAPTWFITFPSSTMTNLGTYTVEVVPPVESIQGQFMPAPFTGTFTVIQGMITGSVTDPNGTPVGDVTLLPSGGLADASTDGSGNFSLVVPPSWSGTLTPYKPGWTFVPAAINFANVTSTQNAQTIIALPPAALALTSTPRGSGLALGWFGVNGLTYQLQSSTDLVNWTPYESPIAGANANLEVNIPTSTDGRMFFRFTVSQ